jgi:hypothetical protein
VPGFGAQLMEVILEIGGEAREGAAELVTTLDEGGIEMSKFMMAPVR